jgi:hypothetical protein
MRVTLGDGIQAVCRLRASARHQETTKHEDKYPAH